MGRGVFRLVGGAEFGLVEPVGPNHAGVFAEFDGVVVGLVWGEVDVVVFPSVDGGGGGAECFGDGVGVGAGWEVVDEVVGGEAPVVFGSAASVGHGVLSLMSCWAIHWATGEATPLPHCL